CYRIAVAIVAWAQGVQITEMARAQDYERVAPKPVPGTPQISDGSAPPMNLLKFDFLPQLQQSPEVATPTPSQPSAPDQKDRQILTDLVGIRLITNLSALKKDGADKIGLTIENLPMLDASALRTSLEAFLHKPLTMADLDAISAVIVDWYRSHDRPFVDVAFPEQDISTGVLQAVVTEFHAGEIRVADNNWFSTELLRDQIR